MIGLGFDIHRITKKKKNLVLAGVKIPCSFGLDAVSDGDVILHAISDALCGAVCLGDIGDYFPPSAKKSKNINSEVIVRMILGKLKSKYRLVNIDVTIVAQRPKLVSHKKKMLMSLKKIFSLSRINVKIKSKEGLSIFGGKSAIACLAIASVEKC